MVKVLVSIHNGLLAEAMTAMLRESGEFEPFPIPVGSKNSNVVSECEMLDVQMALLEVSFVNLLFFRDCKISSGSFDGTMREDKQERR